MQKYGARFREVKETGNLENEKINFLFKKDTFRFEIQDLKGKYGACGKEVVLQFNKMHSIILKNVFFIFCKRHGSETESTGRWGGEVR